MQADCFGQRSPQMYLYLLHAQSWHYARSVMIIIPTNETIIKTWTTSTNITFLINIRKSQTLALVSLTDVPRLPLLASSHRASPHLSDPVLSAMPEIWFSPKPPGIVPVGEREVPKDYSKEQIKAVRPAGSSEQTTGGSRWLYFRAVLTAQWQRESKLATCHSADFCCSVTFYESISSAKQLHTRQSL